MSELTDNPSSDPSSDLAYRLREIVSKRYFFLLETNLFSKVFKKLFEDS